MRITMLAITALLALCLLVSGCTFFGGDDSRDPQYGREPVSEIEAEMVSFSFYRSGSSSSDYGNYTLERIDGDVRLTADFISREPVDIVVGESCLDDLRDIVVRYNLVSWDGFDKTNSRVQDGRSFGLSFAFADGLEVHARGSNAFPEGFSQVETEILKVLEEAMTVGA